MEFNKIWDAITQCWQVKLLVSFFVTIFTFLVGEIEAPFIALWVLVILDTISKWASVSKITLNQQRGDGGIFYGFYLAWHTGALNSREMRQKFVPKVFAYFVVIIAGHMVSIILPSIVIAGGDMAKMPGSLVYSFLAITELMSIIENLIAMGMDVLKPLAIWVGRKRDEITGGDRHEDSN
ncbi:MAG: Holin toxin secretion/phage lysis [Firmicutes bacterium]|nr:Holin toxin secretion/phage lysis [Bacillota bacterium]